MRKELAKIHNERHRFKAKVERFGYKRLRNGEYVQTILLTEIILVDKNKLVCDHCWLNYTTKMQELNLKIGDRIEFDGRVRQYLKAHAANFYDFNIQYPSNICKIEIAKPQKQTSPLLLIFK